MEGKEAAGRMKENGGKKRNVRKVDSGGRDEIKGKKNTRGGEMEDRKKIERKR